MSNNTPARIKAFADRMERIKSEIKGLQDDLKDLKAEMKGEGINETAVDKLVAIRMKDKSKADKQIELFQDMLLYAPHVGVTMDLVQPDADPTPLETAIAAKGDRFDPVRAMAEGIASGDARITKAASFPAGASIEITPSASRSDWTDDLPTRFVSDGGVLRAEAVQ